MKRIEKLSDSLRYLFCSHNELIAEPALIKEVIDSLETLVKENQRFPESNRGLHAYDDDDDKIARYDFEHFSVVGRKEDIPNILKGKALSCITSVPNSTSTHRF